MSYVSYVLIPVSYICVVSQVRTIHTVHYHLTGMLKRSLEGASKYLLEELYICVRDLVRCTCALQSAGNRMQRHRVVSIEHCSNSLQTDNARGLQAKQTGWRKAWHSEVTRCDCWFMYKSARGSMA